MPISAQNPTDMHFSVISFLFFSMRKTFPKIQFDNYNS